jgi:hypothetical protein
MDAVGRRLPKTQDAKMIPASTSIVTLTIRLERLPAWFLEKNCR